MAKTETPNETEKPTLIDTAIDKDTKALIDTLPERYRPNGAYCPGGLTGAVLLAEACVLFGINPSPTAKPIELLSDAWSFKPGDPNDFERYPDRVVLVTAGGLKVAYPMDGRTEEQLRDVFHAFEVDKVTKERRPLPLPEDLTLPAPRRDGRVPEEADHRYLGGYLKTGGKAEAERRDLARRRAVRAKAGR